MALTPTEILQRAAELDGRYAKARCDASQLEHLGWLQLDGGGLFYRSPLSGNNFAVDLGLALPPHISISRNYANTTSLDGATESDLRHIEGKLDDVELWMMG
jgi:hypothetical protein